MALLLVSHDLAVIAGHCDRVIVMYAGLIMESGPVEAVLREPKNPYTLRAARGPAAAGRAARRAAQDHSRRAARSSTANRAGCPFAGRCALTIDICRTTPPPEVAFGADRVSRCHRARRGGARRDERAAAARSLDARQDLSPAGVGPFARRERPAGAGRRELLRSAPGARSGSSANPGPANRRWRASRSRSTGRIPARSGSRGGRCSICRAANCARLRAHMQMIFQDPYGSLDPAPARRKNRRRAARGVGRRDAAPSARARRGVARGGRPQGVRRVEISARVFRRPAPAHRHRARAHHPAEARRRRRAGVGARRLGAGAGAEPDERSAARGRRDLSPDQPRSRRRRAHLRDDRGDVPRAHRRDRPDRRLCSPHPAHPYTRELVDATPRLDRPTRVPPLAPDGAERRGSGRGCPYARRCAFARPRCREEAPALDAVKGEQSRLRGLSFPLIRSASLT